MPRVQAARHFVGSRRFATMAVESGNDARDESNQSHPTFRSQSNERIRYFYQLPSCSCFRVPSPWTFVLTPHNVRAVQIPPGTGRKPIVYYPASAFMSNADFLLQSGWLFSRP